MNQTTLHNYFRGTASEREEKLILDWVDASEENRKMFQKERMLYDLTLFQNTTETKKRDTRSNNLRHITRWGIRVAASVVVLLSCWTLISEYRYNHNSGMQTVTVPPGQRAEITLPDGTKVWLNAKSTLMYATDFGRKERNVELDGEAYFEVTKNAGKTFYVHTETKKIGVVGTSFNVNAYKGTNEFEAVLIEGIIDIYPAESDKIITRLEKNESFLAYQDKQKKIKSGSHEQLRWKDGLYCFDDDSFEYILGKLEKYYSVKFVVESPEVLNYSVTGKFRDKDGVEHILKSIQRDHTFIYKLSATSDTIRISKE